MGAIKKLTTNQEAFLEALFGSAYGDPEVAKKLAGYADSVRVSEIVKALKSEIIELSLDKLSLHSMEAVNELLLLLKNPNSPGANTKLKVVESILNRAGVAQKQDTIDLKVPAGGLFIMPAKEIQTQETVNEPRVIEGSVNHNLDHE